MRQTRTMTSNSSHRMHTLTDILTFLWQLAPGTGDRAPYIRLSLLQGPCPRSHDWCNALLHMRMSPAPGRLRRPIGGVRSKSLPRSAEEISFLPRVPAVKCSLSGWPRALRPCEYVGKLFQGRFFEVSEVIRRPNVALLVPESYPCAPANPKGNYPQFRSLLPPEGHKRSLSHLTLRRNHSNLPTAFF